ncbi:MAG TPA: HD domain-containing protein [Nitrospirae bacterium]|nr:cyclic di-GMP phosphodiesterase response regulator RpfG [bacterium BMS3Abin09]GBE40593.1 cyclic di-GMP phosphodiesterase response regulator RpfG [bacterium BMS3Bbin09]HDZ83759.1 HD domain-containing protein [Nitrospirota bacterium]
MSILQNNITKNNILIDHVKDWGDLLNSLPYPVSIVDPESNSVMINKEMANILDISDKPENAKCYHLFHGSKCPVEECPLQKTIQSGKKEHAEIYDPIRNKLFIESTSPILIEGSLIGVIHTLFDITEIKSVKDSDFDLLEIYAASINDLKTRGIEAQKGRDAFLNMLEDINESYKELEDLFMKFIVVMVNALDAKSPWTKGHSERVSIFAEQIAMEILMDEEEIKNIKLAGLLHDIGKIATYDYLLDKPKGLTNEEFEIVKKHPIQGVNILKEIKQLSEIVPLIRYHHERMDGNGYPDKLSGSHIPLGARILHVADSFDSMTSDRPYRPAPGIKFALSELKKKSGTQFDKRVVEAFMSVLNKQNKT